jgi:hypothetical protein
LRGIDTTRTAKGSETRLTANLLLSGDAATSLEKLVARLSLEPGIHGVHWHAAADPGRGGRGRLARSVPADGVRSTIGARRVETMMGRLAKVLKAIGRFVNRAAKDMADDRPGGGMAARREENMPPDWERKDLGI